MERETKRTCSLCGGVLAPDEVSTARDGTFACASCALREDLLFLQVSLAHTDNRKEIIQ
jgi:hypothetical protein